MWVFYHFLILYAQMQLMNIITRYTFTRMTEEKKKKR